LLAKFGVLAVLCLGQSLVLSAALLNQEGPSVGLLIPWPIAENWLLLWVGMLAIVSLGLLISALARSDVRAQVMIPIVLVLQLLFTGALLDVQKPVIKQLSYVTGSYWLFNGIAASNDLVGIDPACLGTADGRELADSTSHDMQACPEVWSHEPMIVVWCLLALIGLTVAQLALAGAALRALPSGPT
jgi:hypothetical protein